MVLRTNTIIRDDNSDGIPDYRETTYIWTNEAGKLEYQIQDVDHGADDAIDVRFIMDPTYDETGNKVQDNYSRDYGFDGVVEEAWTVSYGYNYDGSLAWKHDGSYTLYIHNQGGVSLMEITDSPDWSGNGIPDYRIVVTEQENDAGLITARETITYIEGQRQPSTDYRLDKYTYNDKNLLTEYRIDDWNEFDFEIAWHYKYNSAGQVTQVKHESEWDYGDNRPRTIETYKYNKDGSLKESNLYDEFMNGQHVLEDKGKFYYDNGLLVKEVHTGQDGDWNTITGWQNEFWHNESGQLIQQLTSFDVNGDGIYEQDTRTWQEWSYNADGSWATHILDTNTGDGIIELQEFSQLIA